MKKLITYILLFILMFTLTACAAAEQPITDLKAFEEQVLADWIKFKNGPANDDFDLFNYYGTDNGYHILRFRAKGVFTADVRKEVVAGYVFENLGSGILLKAYKNGEFIDLQEAYVKGLIRKEAIAKAAELHAEEKNAIE